MPLDGGRPRVVVVHYHEISLKRGNRPLFLRHLARNLERLPSNPSKVPRKVGFHGPIRI